MQLEVARADSHVGYMRGGIQFLAEWGACAGPAWALESAAGIQTLCLEAIIDAGLTVCGKQFVALDGAGVTGVVLLAESHLAIRTWPATAAVSLDVFVCNYLTNNRGKAHAVVDALRALYRPGHENLLQVGRGGIDV